MTFALPILYTDTHDRRVINVEKNGVPGIPVLGLTRNSRQVTPVLGHIHPHILEFGLCLRGALTLESGGKMHAVMPGQIFVNQPGIPQRLTAQPRGLFIYWMHVRLGCTPGKSELLRLPAKEAAFMRDKLRQLPAVVATDTRHVRQAFTRLFQQYDAHGDTYRFLCIRQACLNLLIELLDCSAPKPQPVISERLHAVITQMRQHPEHEYRIDDLAHQAALSPTHFINQFKAITGLPPIHFLLDCRIDSAKQHLRTTRRPITEIALSLGFSSSQHFSNLFKRATGTTPRAWRSANLPGPAK